MIEKRLSNSKFRKYFSFFEFYYYVAKRSPKQYSLAYNNQMDYLAILMTPLILFILSMFPFLFVGNSWTLAIFLLFGLMLPFNLLFTHTVISKGREIEREKFRKIQEEREYARRVEENLRRQSERDEQIRRRREEENRRATQHRRNSEANTEKQIIRLYAVLGINPTTDINVIKKAYRHKAKQHHPDMGGDKLSFTNVNRAYEMILKIIERK